MRGIRSEGVIRAFDLRYTIMWYAFATEIEGKKAEKEIRRNDDWKKEEKAILKAL